MNIVFEPLTVTHTDAVSDGVLVLLLSGFGPVIAAHDALADGALVLGGEAMGDVTDALIQPQIPPIADGVLYLAIEAEGDVHIDGETDVTLALDGLAAVGPIADGGIVVRGEALQVPPLTAYGFVIEQSPQVVSYGGLYFETLEEPMVLGNVCSAQAIAVLHAALALAARSAGRFEGRRTLHNDVAFGQQLAIVYPVLVAEGAVFAPAASFEYRMLVRAISRLLVDTTVRSYGEALQTVTAGLAFGIAAEALALASAAEALQVQVRVADVYTAVERLVIELLVAAQTQGSHQLVVLVSEALVLSPALSSEAALATLVRDSLGFAAMLSLDSGEYIAWVLNTESKGLTRYLNYPFNSFACVGERYYGAAGDGLYRLEGDDDAGVPITARLRMGLSDLNTRKLKQLPEAYLGYSSRGMLLLRVISIDPVTGAKQAALYRLKPRGALNTRENRFAAGRGVKSVDWDFEIENVDGANFDLSSLELRPLMLDRRTRG